jgi:hypothetical protein
MVEVVHSVVSGGAVVVAVTSGVVEVTWVSVALVGSSSGLVVGSSSGLVVGSSSGLVVGSSSGLVVGSGSSGSSVVEVTGQTVVVRGIVEVIVVTPPLGQSGVSGGHSVLVMQVVV